MWFRKKSIKELILIVEWQQRQQQARLPIISILNAISTKSIPVWSKELG